MIERYLGANGKSIPRRDIPFDGDIENHDCIENPEGIRLIYDKTHNSYRLITDNADEFLSNDKLYRPWKLRKQ